MPASDREDCAGMSFVPRLSIAASLAALAIAPAPTAAQETAIPAVIEVSGNADVVTDYRFRGVSRSGGNFAVQGGVDAEHANGLYAGAWASSIDLAPAYGDVELDLYAGYGGKLSEAVSFDAGMLYYAFPFDDDGAETGYFEPYASLSTTLGPAQARVGAAYAWEQDSLGGQDNLYLYGHLGVGVPTTPITLEAHLGYTDGALAPPLQAGSIDKTGFDYSLGATAAVARSLKVGIAYVGVGGPSVDGFTDDTIVGAVGFRF